MGCIDPSRAYGGQSGLSSVCPVKGESEGRVLNEFQQLGRLELDLGDDRVLAIYCDDQDLSVFLRVCIIDIGPMIIAAREFAQHRVPVRGRGLLNDGLELSAGFVVKGLVLKDSNFDVLYSG